jgi:hypothetical protein
MATTPGQPTSYGPQYVELAHKYCLLDATNEVLGDFFSVIRAPFRTGSPPTPDRRLDLQLQSLDQ